MATEEETLDLSMDGTKKNITAIINYLETQKTWGGLDQEEQNNLDVAIQCLEEVYGPITVQDSDDATPQSAQNQLSDIFSAHGPETTEPDFFEPPTIPEPTLEDRQEAERLKSKGNDFMKAEKYKDALDCYTDAIEKEGDNPALFCNRAAAYSKLKEHQKAVDDCQSALRVDPAFSKAYGRMGIAYTALGNHESALACCRRALEMEPDNPSYRSNLEIAEHKLREAAAQGSRATASKGEKSSSGEGASKSQGGMDFSSMFSGSNMMSTIMNFLSKPEGADLLMKGIMDKDPRTTISNILKVGQLLYESSPDKSHQTDNSQTPAFLMDLLTTVNQAMLKRSQDDQGEQK